METVLNLKSYENSGWHGDPLEVNIKIDIIKEATVSTTILGYQT